MFDAVGGCRYAALNRFKRNFMEELYSLLTSELTKSIPALKKSKRIACTKSVFGGTQSQVKLQLNRIPTVIDLGCYRDPHSSDNPTGDYRAAYRFYELADKASKLTNFFEGINSVSCVWSGIINSAVSDNGYVANLLTQAKDSFRLSRMYGMGGVPEDWYQVNALPSNWYDLVTDQKNLTRIEIIPPNGGDDFAWNLSTQENVPLDSDSTLTKICLDVLNVEFIRPWMRWELFEADWTIRGTKRGYFSTGNENYNDGILPLITQSMLVGTNLSIEGDFSEKDKDLLSNHLLERISLGPFAVKTIDAPIQMEHDSNLLRISSKVTQIVGYISYCVPLCPLL